MVDHGGIAQGAAVHAWARTREAERRALPARLIRTSLCSTPPLVPGPPPMDLGRFEISKGPSNRGGLDLGLFEKSNRPSWRGGLDFGLFTKSNRPSKRVETP